MDHSNPSVSLVASLSLQPDLGSSNLPASDPVEASEHLKELLVDFQKSHVTDPSMNGFVDSFKDLLGRVSFPRDYDSQESIPTQLALLEIASQCHNALEDFLRRERALGKRELWFEPAQGGNMHKAAIRSKTWKVNRVNSLVAVLTGHYASISLLWQLYEQSYLNVDVGHSTLSKIKLPSVHSLEWMVPKDGAIKFSDPERTMDVIYGNFRMYLAATALFKRTLDGEPSSQVRFDPPVLLHDAMGHWSPFRLEYIQSKKDLFELLLLRFSNQNRLKKRIEHHKFTLLRQSEENPEHIVGLKESNDKLCDIFSPNDEVNMSVLLPLDSYCEVCSYKVNMGEGRTQCRKCDTFYEQEWPETIQLGDCNVGSFRVPEARTLKGVFTRGDLADLPNRLPVKVEEMTVTYLVSRVGISPGFKEWASQVISASERLDDSKKVFTEKFFRCVDGLGHELAELAQNDLQNKVVGSIMTKRTRLLMQFKQLAQTYDHADAPLEERSKESPTLGAADLIQNQVSRSNKLGNLLKREEPNVFNFLSENMAVLDGFSSKLREALYFDMSQTSKFSDIEVKVDEAAEDLARWGVSTDGHVCASIRVDWELQRFMEEEIKSHRLGSMVTITGRAIYGRATTCSEYLGEMLPEVGPAILQCIESALASDSNTGEAKFPDDGDSKIRASLPKHASTDRHPGNPTQKESAVSVLIGEQSQQSLSAGIASAESILVWAPLLEELSDTLDFDSCKSAQFAEITVFGSVATIKKVACGLAWLAAAIRLSPSNGRLVYSDATFEERTALKGIFGDHTHPTSIHFTIRTKECRPLAKEDLQMCWTPLFPASIIADSFPIRRRPEVGLLGLEIPFNMLLSISGTRTPVRFSEGLILQGRSTALVPTLMVRGRDADDQDCLLWHFMLEPDGITATKVLGDCGRMEPLGIEDLMKLHTFRSFVGWTTAGCVSLAANGYNPSLSKSGAPKLTPLSKFKLRVTQINLGVQIKAGPIATFSAGTTLAPFDQPTVRLPNKSINPGLSSSDSNLDRQWTEPVFFYDSIDRRAWLVTRGSTFLFILHEMAKRKFILGSSGNSSLPRAAMSSDEGTAAKDALKNHRSLIICQSDTKEDITLQMALEKLNIALNNVATESKEADVLPRSKQNILYGWDFIEMIDPRCDAPQRRMAKLKGTSGVWPELCFGYPVFFVDGMDEVIKPTGDGCGKLCQRWKTVPKASDYLAASLLALNPYCTEIISDHKADFEWLTCAVRWQKSHLFSLCCCRDPNCDIHIQNLVSADTEKNPQDCQDYNKWKSGFYEAKVVGLHGAVVFGRGGQPAQAFYVKLFSFIRRKKSPKITLAASSCQVRQTNSELLPPASPSFDTSPTGSTDTLLSTATTLSVTAPEATPHRSSPSIGHPTPTDVGYEAGEAGIQPQGSFQPAPESPDAEVSQSRKNRHPHIFGALRNAMDDPIVSLIVNVVASFCSSAIALAFLIGVLRLSGY